MRLPGDKSLAIRALLLGAVARARTQLENVPAGDDVAHAIDAVRALGARVQVDGDALALAPAPDEAHGNLERVVHVGESATLLRLLAGLLCARPGRVRLTMAPALARRPHDAFISLCAAVAGPGAVVRDGDALVVTGQALRGDVVCATPDASAQQKSALLLAGLSRAGVTEVRQSAVTRAHTEEMLRGLGADVDIADEGRVVRVRGPWRPMRVAGALPGDPSSAALLAIAALDDLGACFEDVSLSRARRGFFEALAEMGVHVDIATRADDAFGPRGDVTVRGAPTRGLTLAAARLPALLDEIPALAAVCVLAPGRSRLAGLAALRGKESDRLAASATLVRAFGAEAEVQGDDLLLAGRPSSFAAQARVETHADHRIAMAALALGRAAHARVALDDTRCIAKSFPGFRGALDALRPER